MTAPLRGTQSLVGQMGWVFGRASLVAIEIAWRWVFGIPFLIVCWIEAQKILVAHPPESAGMNRIDSQNPWVAVVQIARIWAVYQPSVGSALLHIAPIAAVAWVIVSGLGRGLVLNRIEKPSAGRFRPLQMIPLQAAWLLLWVANLWAWLGSMAWVAATHISAAKEPDLVGFAIWGIFLSLGFFTLWALISWPLSIAPIVMLNEDCGPFQALMRSLRLGKPFTSKLVEINLVMGIVNLSLIVLAMVLSAAPLPFSDEISADTMHDVSALSVLFYLVATDYFQIVRLKGFQEFWKMFRGKSGL